MRIQVRRTGGFAGLQRAAEIDTAGRDDAEDWHSLADAVLAGGHSLPRAVMPDGFSYEITVNGRTVRCADPSVTEEQRKLISRVLKEGA